MKFKQLLAARGIHYAVTRFGPAWLRGLAFDAKYQRGSWRFQEEVTGELSAVVRQYLKKGDLLVMGCGGASILAGLEADGLNSALGIDLSEEAIRLAKRYASEKVSFQRADMISFVCPKKYDVILFSESLNYVPHGSLDAFLERLVADLKPGGSIISTLAQPKRYEEILKHIRQRFAVEVDCNFSGSVRHLIVFRSPT